MWQGGELSGCRPHRPRRPQGRRVPGRSPRLRAAPGPVAAGGTAPWPRTCVLPARGCVSTLPLQKRLTEGRTGPREPPKPALLPGSGPETPATRESLRTATSLAAQVAPADLTLQPPRSQRPAPPHRTEETEPRRTPNPAGGSEAESPLLSDSLRSPTRVRRHRDRFVSSDAVPQEGRFLRCRGSAQGSGGKRRLPPSWRETPAMARPAPGPDHAPVPAACRDRAGISSSTPRRGLSVPHREKKPLAILGPPKEYVPA